MGKNYFEKIVLGFVFGLIATSPSFIISLNYDLIIGSIFTLFVPLGIYFGLSKMDKKLKSQDYSIILLMSFILVIVNSLVVIPMLNFASNISELSLTYLPNAYDNLNICHNSFIGLFSSLLFTIVGIILIGFDSNWVNKFEEKKKTK